MKKPELARTLKFVGSLILVLLIIGLIIAAAKRKTATKTKAVAVQIKPLPEGRDLITVGDVLAIIDRSFGFSLEGMPHGSVNIERVERVLENDPFVEDAEAYIDAANIVQIVIEQRIPVMRIIDGLGVNYYLDTNGKKLPLSRNYTARVLIASGNIPPFVPDFLAQKDHLLFQTYDLAKQILADDFLWAMVEQIYLNKQKEFILIPKLGKQKIYLGTYENMGDKLANLKLFYAKAIAEEGWQKYSAFDLRYDGQIVGRR